VEVVSAAEAGFAGEVEETGNSFAENAMLKAKAVMRSTGFPAVADDSGLAVDALGGAPGVYSARYGGGDLTDEVRYRLLLSNLRGQTRRSCRFVCSIACAFPTGDTRTAEGTCDGVVAFAPQGTGGFGYDPVFFYPPLKKPMGQMSPEEKHQISHRGKALRKFKEELENYYGTDR
jgi:XTP/dITP diphosphohydrolase